MWMGYAILRALDRDALAQTGNPKPIRVETRDVYVPVLVVDKRRITQLQKMSPYKYDQELLANHLDFGAVAVRDLKAGDFRLFEDGREQKIQSVLPEFQLAQPFHDSLGLSEDFVGAGGGRWIAPGVSNDYVGGRLLDVPDWPGYLVAYVPPGEADGRCHHVTVTVGRPHLEVFGRTEYCNNSDPLKGMDVGNEIQSDLASGKTGTIGLSLAAVEFFTGRHESRVQILGQLLAKPYLSHRQRMRRAPGDSLTRIDSREGWIVGGPVSSDFTSRNFSPRGQAMPLLLPNSHGPISCSADGPSYDTQIRLPPGEYDLQIRPERWNRVW